MVNNMRSDEIVKDFLVSINEKAQLRRDQLERETAAYISGEVSRSNEKFKAVKDAAVLRRKSLIMSDIGRELSRKKREAIGALYERRKELTDEVFLEVSEKVKNFTESNEYESALIAIAQKAVQITGNNSEIFIRPADMKYAGIIKASLPDCNIYEDSTITLGGARIVSSCGSLAVDSSYDSAVYEQQKNFLSTSNLIIGEATND